VSSSKVVYWHRDLPPLDAVVMGEHTVEAHSARVPGTLAHRNDLWDACYQQLMAQAADRVAAEVSRLGGHYAHVHGESIGAKHDDAAGVAWLHGTFTYVLYSRDQVPALVTGHSLGGRS
jgi:hypothetical protein